jgi:hypothetical protein
MANLGFGLDINENAQKNGYDLYQTTLGEAISATAADAWNFNPLQSSIRLYELESNRNAETNEPLIDRQELNKKYAEEGLFFYEDEKQSTVDILLERKRAERKRQDIIQRGPKGFLPGTAKFLTGLTVSLADPINIAAAFVPVVGEARFASLVARYGFTKARLARGAVEGFVGTSLVEPLILTAAQREQADYGLMDSFLNVTFGTILGGGLHVGAGKLKDFRTRLQFDERIRKAREEAGIDSDVDPELNLYKEYYPENSEIMVALEKSDPETRRLLLTRALSDLMEENPVEVRDIANLDPKLNEALAVDDFKRSLESTTALTPIDALEFQAKLKKRPTSLQEIAEMYESTTALERKLERLKKRFKVVKEGTKEKKQLELRINRMQDKINRKQQVVSEYNQRRKIVTEEKTTPRITKSTDQVDLENFERTTTQVDIENRNIDIENESIEVQVNQLRERQKNLGIEFDDEISPFTKTLENFNTNKKNIKDLIKDSINCVNGK